MSPNWVSFDYQLIFIVILLIGQAIVRHGKDLFKAEGAVNAAEPGNTGTN